MTNKEDKVTLSVDEIRRYSRHISLPEIGMKGQERLKASRILVVGAGGLGCPVLLYLAAAGVGEIGIIDFDLVDESNLQRQVLFDSQDAGQPKSEVAKKKLDSLNPHLTITAHVKRLDSTNALEILDSYDLIVDGSDNFATRYLVNDACVLLGKPFVYGAVFKFEGQVSVFNYTDRLGKQGPTYRCLFPHPPAPGSVPNCAEIGVLGALPGTIGCMQAMEAFKIITGVGEPLSGKLFLFDSLSMHSRIIHFERSSQPLEITELIDYEEFCGSCTVNSRVEDITPVTLSEMRARGDCFELLDVRESFERKICSLGGAAIPLHAVRDSVANICRDKPVIIYCHHGQRSREAASVLATEFGFTNLYSLRGGIQAWADEVEPDMPRY